MAFDLPNHPLFNIVVGTGGAILFAAGLLRLVEIEPIEDETEEANKQELQDSILLQALDLIERTQKQNELLWQNMNLQNQPILERALKAEERVKMLEAELEGIHNGT